MDRISILVLAVAVASLVYAVFAFRQRGPILTKFYFEANAAQKERMKNKETYRFVGILYCLISLMFFLATAALLFEPPWAIPAVLVVAAVVAVVAIIGSVRFQVKDNF